MTFPHFVSLLSGRPLRLTQSHFRWPSAICDRKFPTLSTIVQSNSGSLEGKKFKLIADVHSLNLSEFANQIQDWEGTNANSVTSSAK
jgi:hypothetical protein